MTRPALLGVLLVALSSTGCINTLVGGVRGGVSTQGNVRVGVPVAIGIPFRVDGPDDPTTTPAHVMAIGVTGSVEAFILPDRGEASFYGGGGPFLQYTATFGNHSVGGLLRGGPAMTAVPTRGGDYPGETVIGTLALELLYRVALSQGATAASQAPAFERTSLGFSLGVELAPSGSHFYTDDPEVFFLLGISTVYEKMLTGGEPLNTRPLP